MKDLLATLALASLAAGALGCVISYVWFVMAHNVLPEGGADVLNWMVPF